MTRVGPFSVLSSSSTASWLYKVRRLPSGHYYFLEKKQSHPRLILLDEFQVQWAILSDVVSGVIVMMMMMLPFFLSPPKYSLLVTITSQVTAIYTKSV
jgi:hypothetical protein